MDDKDWLVELIIDKELTPSVCEDSGQAEWCLGEAQKLASAIRAEIGKRIDALQNPYPEDIFTPATKEQCAMAHKKLQEIGLTLDKFSGEMGRRVFNFCREDVKKALGVEK